MRCLMRSGQQTGACGSYRALFAECGFSVTFDVVYSVAAEVCRIGMVTRAKRLNALSTFNRIPHEIMLMIFGNLPTTSRWTVAAVCDLWRSVSLVNSALWAEVVCEIDKRGSRPCLQMAVRRAGVQLTTLSIRFGMDTKHLQISLFCDTLPSWADRVVLLKITIQLHRNSSSCSGTHTTDDTDDATRNSVSEATGVTDHLARLLSQAISSTLFPQLEALVLVHIPLRFHHNRLVALKRLTCLAGVLLESGASLKHLVVLRTSHLTSTRSEALAVDFAQPMSLQQFCAAQCIAVLAAVLQQSRSPPPLANLRHLHWPVLRLLDPVMSRNLIMACSDRHWIHYVPWDWNIQMRLAYVAERLPPNSIVELQYNRGPSSMDAFLQIITLSNAQWLFPRSLCDEAPSTLTSRSLGSAITNLTVFSHMQCTRCLLMPQLKTLGILIAAQTVVAPLIIMHGKGIIWRLPKLEVLRLERESNNGRGMTDVVGRSAGDAQVPFKAVWVDSVVTMCSAEIARFVRENVEHGGHLDTLVLCGVSLQGAEHIPAPMTKVVRQDLAAEVEFKVPYIYAEDREVINMYAAMTRSVQ